jgi:hypothetical protein
MKKRFLFLAIILVFMALMAGCSDSEDNGGTSDSETQGNQSVITDVISIDLSGGGDDFVGYEPEVLHLDVVQQGEEKHLDFVGVSLDVLFDRMSITEFVKIELVISDMEENMDITDWAKAEAGVFLAWSESGVPETPIRVFPKDAGTANLLIRNVTEIIVTNVNNK